MIANKVSREILNRAAESVGVDLDMSPLNQKGTRHRVKVYPKVPADCYTPRGRRRAGSDGDAPYQRESVGWGNAGRRVHAVCWHGFRDFFRAVFEHAPDAVFRTALDVWAGSADFEARFPASGHKNIGPQIAPVPICYACRCPDQGYAG